MAEPTRQDDEKLLRMLEFKAAGHKQGALMERFGMSKGAVAGILHRVRTDTNAVPCKCRKRANKDGGMPSGWWK